MVRRDAHGCLGIFAILFCSKLANSVFLLQLPSDATDWELFKVQYKKSYPTTVEDNFRKLIYLQNRQKIVKHNLNYELNRTSYKLKLNEFGDQLNFELTEQRNGAGKRYNSASIHGASFISPLNLVVPKELDWRELGAVTEIKDQGPCGSCWAFSAIGALEGQNFLKSERLVSLNEQNVIDCSKKYGEGACDGGLVHRAFQIMQKNKDSALTSDAFSVLVEHVLSLGGFNISNQDNGCTFEDNIAVTGFVNLPEGNETILLDAVASVGPIAVVIDASQESFQFYSSGIYYDSSCSSDVNHAVLLIGYGRNDSTNEDYWIIKNSWGTTWGEDGYMKIARNRDNHCGIASAASYPLI